MQRNHRIRRLLFRLLLLSALSWLINLIRRDADSWEYPEPSHWEPTGPKSDEASIADASERPRKAAFGSPRPLSARRVATSLAFAVLFFAGAAFTAGAGDQVARFVDGTNKCLTDDMASSLAPDSASTDQSDSCAEEASAEPEAAPEDGASSDDAEAAPDVSAEAPEQEGQDSSADEAEASGSSDDAAADESASEDSEVALPHAAVKPQERPIVARGTHRWVVKRARSVPAHPAELEGPAGAATIWLNRALPDPTPPARRLAPRFARTLARVARVEHVDWALLLAVVRAQGDRSAVPATRGELHVLAKRLRAEGVSRDAWASVLAISGRTGFADRTMALKHYNRAVGLRALVTGLEAAKPRLVKGLLADPRAAIYAGGREDLRRDRVDVRVVVLIRYLAERFGQVTVSSMFSGHRMYARPGVVSAHIYGHAVDISGLSSSTIFGNQEPGGLTETAVRAILLLPAEMQPRQVISLLGLGGPSFPLADHGDHIHVGY